MQPLRLGTSSDLEVGQKVYAIGNPFGCVPRRGGCLGSRSERGRHAERWRVLTLEGAAKARPASWPARFSTRRQAGRRAGRAAAGCSPCWRPPACPAPPPALPPPLPRLDHTLTSGVISGTGREISSGNTGRPIQDVIQTDAAINPGARAPRRVAGRLAGWLAGWKSMAAHTRTGCLLGPRRATTPPCAPGPDRPAPAPRAGNSGGPLLDSGGAMIGINTAIYSPSGDRA